MSDCEDSIPSSDVRLKISWCNFYDCLSTSVIRLKQFPSRLCTFLLDQL